MSEKEILTMMQLLQKFGVMLKDTRVEMGDYKAWQLKIANIQIYIDKELALREKAKLNRDKGNNTESDTIQA